jgi:DNA replication protein DnaT
MSPQEFLLLNQPRLSHPARTLYCLHLRRMAAQKQPIQINYPELGRALAVEDPQTASGFSYQVTARQLTSLFDELALAGLIQIDQISSEGGHYHQQYVSLPLLASMAAPIAQQAFAMHTEWQPDHQFVGICQLCGLIDPHYDEEERGEFIAYWLGRPERFATQHQWMMKFVKMLKSRRYQRKQSDTIGYQQVATEAPSDINNEPSQRALEMIAHAQQLKQQQGDDHE